MKDERAHKSAFMDSFSKKKCFVEYQELRETLLTKSFVKICSITFDKILSSKSLSSNEKLFLILVEAISEINKSSPKRSGQKSSNNSAQSIATMLGLSRRYVFIIQKNLSDKNIINISKSKVNNQHERNQISVNITNEKCEKFIPINFNLLKLVLSKKNIKPGDKLLWLYCYKRTHIQFISKSSCLFFDTIKEIKERVGQSESSIRKSILSLEKNFLIVKEKSKVNREKAERKDKLLLILGAILPEEMFVTLNNQKNRKTFNMKEQNNSFDIKLLDHHEGKIFHHDEPKRSLLSNKNNNKDIINKIFTVDKTHKTDKNEKVKNETLNKDNKNEEERKNFVIRILSFMKKNTDISVYNKLDLFLEKGNEEELYHLKEIKNKPLEYFKHCKDKNEIKLLEEVTLKGKFFVCQKKEASFNRGTNIFNQGEFNIFQRKKKYFSTIEEAERYIGESNSIEKEVEKSMEFLSKEEYFKIKNYIIKMKRNGDISRSFCNIDTHRLINEAICFAAYWKPSKNIKNINCRKERFSFILSVIGSLIAKGTWKTPSNYLVAERKDIVNRQEIHRALNHGLDI